MYSIIDKEILQEKIKNHNLYLKGNEEKEYFYADEIDFSNSNLKGLDLSYIWISSSYFNKSNKKYFKGQNLYNSKFYDCKFENMIFYKVDIAKSVFNYSIFENCIFKDCKIIKTDFINTKFKNIKFINCKIYNSFAYTKLRNVRFEGSIFDEDFYKCDLKNIIIIY